LACDNGGQGDNSRLEKLTGEEIYNSNCIICHGVNGKLSSGGATDLSSSKIGDKEMRKIIKEGKELMPPFDYAIKDTAEMDELIAYVKSLREE
jgi:mono/diheme cytochrome c family protein